MVEMMDKSVGIGADPAGCTGALALLVDRTAAGGAGRGIVFAAAHEAQTVDVVAMALHARGICTVTVNESTAMRLGLYAQGQSPRVGDEPYGVNSVEAVACDETGISARERATTMRALANPAAVAEDLVTPGHVMVQVARNILRAGATLGEQANALLSASGVARFAAWSDILNDSGEIGDAAWCAALARRLDIACYDAGTARNFARHRLGAWDEVVRFSASHFGDIAPTQP